MDGRRLGRWAWLIAIVGALVWWACNPTAFTPERIRDFFQKYQSAAVIIYFLVSMIRGCFLIPGTPFVLAGVLLFPERPWLVFAISLLGMIVGSTIIYFFSDKLGFAEVLEKKHASGIATVRNRMKQHGMLIVVAWSFFPLVPTDLICYVAGVVRMNYTRFIIALTIGEAILIGAYVFLGASALSW